MTTVPASTANEQADYHAFMVRVWRGPEGWQGELFSLNGSATLSFVGLHELLGRLAASLGAPEGPPIEPVG